jgi:hypothetical protein
MICETKKAAHLACGLCQTCYRRTGTRILSSLRKRAPAKSLAQPDFMDSVRMARASLAPSIETPTIETTPRRRAK